MSSIIKYTLPVTAHRNESLCAVTGHRNSVNPEIGLKSTVGKDVKETNTQTNNTSNVLTRKGASFWIRHLF